MYKDMYGWRSFVIAHECKLIKCEVKIIVGSIVCGKLKDLGFSDRKKVTKERKVVVNFRRTNEIQNFTFIRYTYLFKGR